MDMGGGYTMWIWGGGGGYTMWIWAGGGGGGGGAIRCGYGGLYDVDISDLV